ncbi:plasmid mobilization protein [Nitrospirillum viridazoti]|uniref:plasmid mobilization protein n=1 Tax=Nitrospirillum viridazoti TaxID=3144925 RepID=UPI001300C90E|nr:hypothetical protein [Nitrospirillum amazonense]
MPRPRKKAEDLRRRFTVRFSAEEHDDIKGRAQAAGLSVADFIRSAALARHLIEVPNVHNVRAWHEIKAIASELRGLTYLVENGHPLAEQLSNRVAELRPPLGQLCAALLGGGRTGRHDDD